MGFCGKGFLLPGWGWEKATRSREVNEICKSERPGKLLRMSVGESSHRQLREKDSSCGGFKEERRENLRSEAAVYKLDLFFFSPYKFRLLWCGIWKLRESETGLHRVLDNIRVILSKVENYYHFNRNMTLYTLSKFCHVPMEHIYSLLFTESHWTRLKSYFSDVAIWSGGPKPS